MTICKKWGAFRALVAMLNAVFAGRPLNANAPRLGKAIASFLARFPIVLDFKAIGVCR
jgi:hypothetical protein